MAPLLVKLEYNKKSGTSDDAVYVHLAVDPWAYYRPQTGKEEYVALDPEYQDSFANGLFAIPGITEISITAYRVWYMKSPLFDWINVNENALNFMMSFYGFDSISPIYGSALTNGTGLRLESETNRRST